MTLPFTFNITLAQINPIVGDLEGNLNKVRHIRDKHANGGLIIFSEMVLTGYSADDLLLKPSFTKNVKTNIDTLVEESNNTSTYILIGTPLHEDGKLYNAALVIGAGQIQHKTLKHNLPNYSVFDEDRYFEPSADLPDIFGFKNTKIGIMICEDMWSTKVSNHLKSQGAEQLIALNGSPFHSDVSDFRHKQASARVQETNLPLIYVNQVGGQDDLVFDGQSFSMDKDGNITHQLPSFEEAIVSLNEKFKPLKTSVEEKIYKAITLGLHDYVQKNGFKGVLIGLSGGIDSAISATIAVDAIGAENVHCVIMPSPYTSQESLDDAAECAKLLGVQLDTIPISNGMAALEGMLENHADKSSDSITFENIQSRLRGITLMALSNETGKMVLSTGNKSEMAVGYTTLYGDMCGGYNAIKDIYKTQVYKLAKWRNKQNKVIPKQIITKAPSAELKPDQTDQDSLPPYDILDDILECLIEKEMAFEDIPHDPEIVRQVYTMLKNTEYKRYQAPPGPKVTSKAFGRDRRYPLTNGFLKNPSKQST